MELFRQTGLAQGAASSDLMRAATSMVKYTLNIGDVLYRKGEPANRLFLIVSGDFVLDTTEPDKSNTDAKGKFVPFLHRYVFTNMQPFKRVRIFMKVIYLMMLSLYIYIYLFHSGL